MSEAIEINSYASIFKRLSRQYIEYLALRYNNMLINVFKGFLVVFLVDRYVSYVY